MERELILITGGGGSLGAELAMRLCSAGNRVRVFDLPGLDYARLEDIPGIEVFQGDITDRAAVSRAAEDVSTVVHLAALLPPAAEGDWARTEAINVAGTGGLLEAVKGGNEEAHFIFSSSVAVYGDTTGESEPISPEREPSPSDHYSRSKALAEDLVRGAGLPFTILRISGIAIPAFLEPPPVWPFMRQQRMEFVCRGDVITALFNCVGNGEACGRVFNIAGGDTWRMLGHQYVEALFGLMGVDPEEAGYLGHPGWFDWYQTSGSQAVLDYQHTGFPAFMSKVEEAVRELMG
jgi:nucleoside-diphosphate-sugar epimerase